MRRPYNLRMYRALAERLAGAMPDLGLGTDLIAGHPGERADDLAATMRVVDELPFSYLHVFPYSDRKGTEAAGRADHVPPRIVRERSARLRALGRAKNHAFRSALVGQRREAVVLAERDRETGFLVGLTSNYVEVLMSGPADLARRFARVRITAAGTDRTFGVLEEVLDEPRGSDERAMGRCDETNGGQRIPRGSITSPGNQIGTPTVGAHEVNDGQVILRGRIA
jgi:threonylcarbamoyladenosine tRNA methylthiotransferase MtaB